MGAASPYEFNAIRNGVHRAEFHISANSIARLRLIGPGIRERPAASECAPVPAVKPLAMMAWACGQEFTIVK
jgi:hypothetical protein